MPSAWTAFASAPSLSNIRTRGQSAFSAASASRVSAAVAADPIQHTPNRTTSDLRPWLIGDSWSSQPQWLKQPFHLAVAVAELVDTNAGLGEQGQVQVGQWGRLLEADVPPALHSCGCALSYQDRQVGVVVYVRIAHTTAVQVDRVIEQSAVPFLGRLELAEKLREQRHVEPVDLGDLGDLLGVVAVVRKRVVRVGHADLGIGAVTGFARELEGDHARDVPL